MRKVTAEQEPTSTVEFIRQPREAACQTCHDGEAVAWLAWAASEYHINVCEACRVSALAQLERDDEFVWGWVK